MTISYQRDVASSTAGGFTRLLFKWKGSLYKLIYRELFLFLSAYILLSMVYRQILTQHQRGLFEMVVKYFDAFINLIPLSFVLGFYVSYVASRWWQQFLAIPWPDKLFHSVACFVDGFDEESRLLRRSLMRYMNLALILVLRSISSAVKQRFPTLDHVVEAGFMTNQEKELFSAVPANEFNTYWIPCTWFIYRLQEASKRGKLLNAYALETIMREFCEFRAKCGLLWCYDWVSIPMVYTQVVTLATYLFFVFTVIGRQKIDTLKKGEYMRSGRMPMDIDLYIPVYTVLQFFFYMGLLKVAEQLINPFGDDDEDFELNWLVDRHMKASFLGCDILMDPDRIPPMVKDYYWDKQNCPIPYTEASMHFKKKTYKGSADDMIVPESKQHMVLPEIEEEDEDLNQRHSKLSLTSLLLESTQLVTSPSMGLGTSQLNPKSSNIVTKIGLGDTASVTGQDNSSSPVPPDPSRSPDGANGLAVNPAMSLEAMGGYDTPASSFQGSSSRAFNMMGGMGAGSWRANGGSSTMTSTPAPTSTPFPRETPGTRRGPSDAAASSEVLSASAANLSSLDSSGGQINPTSVNNQNYLAAPNLAAVLLRRGSDSSLPVKLKGTSFESITDDEEFERRGSLAAAAAGRRGSRLLEFLEKKRKPKRYKDKQGFVWRRMIHDQDDYLPSPRAPHLGQGATPWVYPSASTSSGPSSFGINSPSPNVVNHRKISALLNNPPQGGSRSFEQQQEDATSMTSFKTCPSDPNLTMNNYLPTRPAMQSQHPQNYDAPVPLPVVVPRSETLPTTARIHPNANNMSDTTTSDLSNVNIIDGIKHLVRSPNAPAADPASANENH